MEKSWTVDYMVELKAPRRKEILEAAIASEGMSPANELRRRLFDYRYGRREGQDVDYFIRGWMNMYYLNTTSRTLFGRAKVQKELKGIRADWKIDLAAEYGEIGRQVLYEEFCNMCLLYFSLCQTDRSYSSILLGLGRMKEENIVVKIAKDVYTLAYEVPFRTDSVELFAEFTRAATDMFCQSYGSQKEALLHMIEKGRD